MMVVSRDQRGAVEWYNRVIAVSLATLAGQAACGLESVARAQFTCGAQSNPCYVTFDPNDPVIYRNEFNDGDLYLKTTQ